MDPIFGPGSSHGATIPVTVEPGDLSCQLELYLTPDGGVTKAATSGLVPFTSTGAQQNVSTGPIAMPADGVSYDVYIDVLADGMLIGGYIATEKVTITSVEVKIYASIAGQGAAMRTVHGGEDRKEKWYEAWLADNSDYGQFVKYPPDTASGPFGWWGEAMGGVRRGIAFFDTTGVTEDKSLYLFNSKVSEPCYYTPGELIYVLSGNGANPDFDKEIYGWIRGRFLPQYLIGSKLVGAIYCQAWGEIFIPKAFINSEGYTVLIVVLEKDYSCDKNHDGVIGTYLRLDTAYLDTPHI